MNWEAIGAVGEVVGAIAVFATLAYLAVQVRYSRTLLEESRKIALSQVHQSRTEFRRENLRGIADSNHLAELLTKVSIDKGGIKDFHTFTEVEKIRLVGHYGSILQHQEGNLYQNELGLLDQPTLENSSQAILFFRPVWEQLDIELPQRVRDWYATYEEGA